MIEAARRARRLPLHAARRDHIEALRQFRNAQIDVLRQAEPIAEDQQERWFEGVVEPAQASSSRRRS